MEKVLPLASSEVRQRTQGLDEERDHPSCFRAADLVCRTSIQIPQCCCGRHQFGRARNIDNPPLNEGQVGPLLL
jgi:hypothetical protein